MILLENALLRVTVDPKGAQLTSLVDKATNTERLWQADPAIWPWHAPNLFPIVGGLRNDVLQIDGRVYPMNRHGFARQSRFAVEDAKSDQARFLLTDSEQTRVMYPYRFALRVDYRLAESALIVTYSVDNQDTKSVYFSVGAHPAFRVPVGVNEEYTDYFLEFDREETLQTHLLSANGLFTGEVRPVPMDGNRLWLTRTLFDRDALVFKNVASRRVTLRSRNGAGGLAVSFADFPYLGIWAKPGADFVCIEPWLGCADAEGGPVPIDRKEAIQCVGVGERFSATFSVAVSDS